MTARPRQARRRPVGLAALALLAATSAFAQVPRLPELGGRTSSLGQPTLWHWQLGFGAGGYYPGPGSATLLRAEAGMFRSLVNPIASFAELGVEAYGGLRDSDADGGFRVLLRVPYLGMGAGPDYNLLDGRTELLVTARTPVRRGGIFRRGTMLRFNWYPTNGNSFTLGVSTPLGDRLAGRNRPVRDYVMVAAEYPQPEPHQQADAALLLALDSLRVSAHWIRRMVVPFLDQDGRSAAIAEQRTTDALVQLRERLATRSAEDEVRSYHAQLERLFTLAAGNDAAGRALKAQACNILLLEVLAPYNRLLGRKKHRDTLDELAVAARGRFGRWMAASGLVLSDSAAERALFVFQQVTGILERERRAASNEWDDARLAWLPLQYALLPEQHDEQAELETLIEQVSDVRFRERNQVTYVANLQFHSELLQMIRETRKYHVLWIHDFPAVSDGRADRASLEVVRGYLNALTERVAAYDSTGQLPSYFILLDEHYYEARHSRALMTILEDPLDAAVTLPEASEQQLDSLRAAVTRLRAAVQGSRVLRAEAREYGDAWLRNRVKVHVNITNRADASFWGGGVVSSVFGYPDDVMRDHRKVAFRDVWEDDPSGGVAILTGMGVGSQYMGPSWDDRALIVRGPVLADLKSAARDLLLGQGLTADDLPLQLRASPLAVQQTGEPGVRAALLVNGVGYQPKMINVAKAVLYTLMPPGSVFKIPDSLWNSTFFGACLAGAALRGAHVLIIAPAQTNAPSKGFPALMRANELFTRLLLVRQVLGEPMARAGGELRTGLYALPLDGHGFPSRADRWAHQADSSTFLRALLPFSPALVPVAQAMAGDSAQWQQPADSSGIPLPPRLHQKVQFMATPQLWRAVTSSPDWPRFMATYLDYRRATYQSTVRADEVGPLTDSLAAIAARIGAGTGTLAGAAGFAMVGSQNMDYRGMFMDGEIVLLYTGTDALIPLMDLVFMAGTVTWIDDRATLDRLLPPTGEMRRRVARIAKDGV